MAQATKIVDLYWLDSTGIKVRARKATDPKHIDEDGNDITPSTFPALAFGKPIRYTDTIELTTDDGSYTWIGIGVEWGKNSGKWDILFADEADKDAFLEGFANDKLVMLTDESKTTTEFDANNIDHSKSPLLFTVMNPRVAKEPQVQSTKPVVW